MWEHTDVHPPSRINVPLSAAPPSMSLTPPLQTIMERPDAALAEVKDTRTKEEIEAAIAEDESRARAVVLEMVREPHPPIPPFPTPYTHTHYEHMHHTTSLLCCMCSCPHTSNLRAHAFMHVCSGVRVHRACYMTCVLFPTGG